MLENEKKALELTKYDALQEAENLTGESYKTDKDTENIGFLLHMANNKELSNLLDEIKDTKFSENEFDYVNKLSRFGFEVVLKEPFLNTHYKDVTEHFYILFNKELGVLIAFDTFGYEKNKPHNVNGGNIYYNWTSNDDSASCLSSGGYIQNSLDNILFNSDFTPHEIDRNVLPEQPKWELGVGWEEFYKLFSTWSKKYEAYKLDNNLKYIWSGNHDCRTGAITNIKNLIENGTLLTKWVECPFSWLLNFSEYSNEKESHDKFTERAKIITKKRIEKLPKHVQECIGVFK